MPRWLLALGLLLGFAAPRLARATDDPVLRIDGEAGYACYGEDRRYHGMFASAEAAYAWNTLFAVRGGYGLGVHRSKGDAFEIHQVSAGLRYQLDVFTYVPWVDLSPAVYFRSGEGGPADDVTGGVAVGLGFDYLFDPAWSLGFAAHYHQMLGADRFPAYLTLGLRLGHRFVIGDPFGD
ncbi:MAG: hypothetical protein KC620_01595 [Myxococcales bacterium]|nr:hypothetical protein [Myxococcales bacterium]